VDCRFGHKKVTSPTIPTNNHVTLWSSLDPNGTMNCRMNIIMYMKLAAIPQARAEDLPFHIFHQATQKMTTTAIVNDGA
jgi:hypothetical protein